MKAAKLSKRQKYLILALCAVASVAATSDQLATVVRSDFQQSPEGAFQYAYETDNGINGQAAGVVKVLGKDEIALEVTGSNSYQSPEGEKVQLTWIANENGYQPQGSHLPTPPPPLPTPEYVLRAIEYIKAHPYEEQKP